jgi:predicted GNAT family acetyltransferase
VIVSGLPANCAGAAAEILAGMYPNLAGAVGPRPETEMFAQRWSACTGAVAHERIAQRAFDLHRLTPPGGVPGVTWWAGEVANGLRERGVRRPARSPQRRQQVVHGFAAGTAALLWEMDAQPVVWASARTPVAGMSRIGPVYTLPQHRGHGYGRAVTASWSLQAGAKYVVLNTDLSNPISNAIYPRIGFRPVYDAVEIAFERPL